MNTMNGQNLIEAAHFTNLMATFRLTEKFSATVRVDVDQYGDRDLGYRAGLAHHF